MSTVADTVRVESNVTSGGVEDENTDADALGKSARRMLLRTED